jgi:hypothetical protein
MAPPLRGKPRIMEDDRSGERTETDERVAENRAPAPVASVTRDDDPSVDPATGLPRGMHDDDASPLDRGESLDPFGGKPPSERIPAMKPGEAQDQAFGSINDPIEE